MPELDSGAKPAEVFATNRTSAVDYAQLGLNVGIFAIGSSIVAGTVALMQKRMDFYNRMFRTRMIIVATTAGYYAAASGWLPPPPLLNTIMGKEPRPVPDAPQLSPRPSSTSTS